MAASVAALYDEPTTPPGRGDVVVSASAGRIINWRFFVLLRFVGLVASVTVTLTVNVPFAVGVPLIALLAESTDNPPGRPVAVQL